MAARLLGQLHRVAGAKIVGGYVYTLAVDQNAVVTHQLARLGAGSAEAHAVGAGVQAAFQQLDLFLVAEQNGEIIGTIIGAFDGRRGMIYHLAVHNAFRRQGIGQALLAEVEKRLKEKGCIKCLLMVLEDNETAKRFYEESGWKAVPEDLVFMKMFI